MPFIFEPLHQKEIDRLKRLQHLAARMVTGCRDLSYEEDFESSAYFPLHIEDLEVV